ncbi:MAG TPA: transposase [Noviherbaspirillum sp.]|nr:transposase [Noviherbaspirillum sp.]
MARYKPVRYDKTHTVSVAFSEQIFPGSFEHTLNQIVDHELDLSIFDSHYHNDTRGAPAWHPAVMLKIIFYAYSRGITSSREIERCCRENIIFMALSANSQPHFTTIADFISSMGEEITPLFLEVLLICDEMHLIGKEMFAIDGCKMPANASREWSGTTQELAKKAQKMERALRCMIARHQYEDVRGKPALAGRKEAQRQQTLQQKIDKIKRWLDDHDDKPGKGKKPRKSNVTDNDSAKMKTSHGTLQGYDGVATVDAKHQVVVHACAYGEPQEHDLLLPMVVGTRENFQAIDRHADVFRRAALTADSGFHTDANVDALDQLGIDAYLADKLFRKRDARFAQAERYRARHKAEQRKSRHSVYRPSDFQYDPLRRTCICPAGKALYQSGNNCHIKGREYVKFTGPKKYCVPCEQRQQCLRHPDRTPVRAVVFAKPVQAERALSCPERMKQKIDSEWGRQQYGRRLATVEPVFGNITHNIGLGRFSLRGWVKVNVQWKLYCIVHNLFKIHRYGIGMH